MANQRAAIIEESTLRVDNMTIVSSAPPDLPSGYRYLTEAQWAAGQTPAIGMIWNGDLPATFVEAPPVDPQDIPANIPDAVLAVETAQAQLNQALANLSQVASG